MKKKILGIFVCMLLIAAAVLPVAGNLNKESLKEVYNKKLGEPLDRAYKDAIVKVQQTTDGGYIAFGFTDSYGAGLADAWIIKTDSNGNKEWNNTYGTGSQDCAFGGQQTSDGGYIIVGLYSNLDVWLVKTDSNGDEQWSETYGGTAYDIGYFVQQTSDGGYIITGYTQSYDVGVRDIWLIKTDSNGNEEWNNTFGGINSDGGFVVREIDDGDGYIITGWTASYGAGTHDAWLIKTDSDGNEMWNKTFGGTSEDEGHDVQQTSDGGYIIIGCTDSYGSGHDFWLIKTDENGVEEWNNTFAGHSATTDIAPFNFNGGLSVLEITDGYIITGVGEGGPGGGTTDVSLIETDEYGNEQWNKTFGGSLSDDAYWIDETSDGGYIIGGATFSYANPPYYDGWLIKTDSNGNEDWNKTFGTGYTVNNPPGNPSIPDGPENGIIDIEYMFNTSAEDPDGDDVYYLFDWGDGTDSGWVGPYPSGNTGGASHSWDDEGDYEIRAKAKDEDNLESDWSPTLTIYITEENELPGKPTISGRKEGKNGKEYEYTFRAVDADGDDVRYNISWGDSSQEWTDYYTQDTVVKVKHTFEEEGTYKIKAYAQDVYGADGPETEYEVTMPKNKLFIFNFPLLNWLFERFPNVFPMLRYLLGL